MVVGLGNPGPKYAGTRHNVGFDVVTVLADRHQGDLRTAKRERVETAEVRLDGQRVVLAMPTTFMNLSGEAVAPMVRRCGLEDPQRLVVVHDELDLPLGRMKVKVGGGLAGHNGLRSIKAHCHTDDFVRVRLGVGKPADPSRGADHVLRPVGRSEREVLDRVVDAAADAVEMVVADGPERAMERWNGVDLATTPGA
ncbi:MAG: aminoacyl-tRNA hydrolase [Acidimicrobiia bacterium]|nr:aminoacyl-tRNA hydrolase [Acidimicrobiia bacterium]